MKIELHDFLLYADENKDRLLFSADQIEFKQGQMNLIMGHSGTGKTTLLNALYGQKSYYHGHIQTDQSEYDRKKISVSYVTADPCVIPELKTYEYLRIVSDNEEQINHLLSLFHILNLKDERLSKCSRGEQTRVEICAALLKKSDLYLFDEPTANIDSETKKLVYEVLKDFSTTHLVIIATHDAFLLKEECNAWEIRDGKLVSIITGKNKKDGNVLSLEEGKESCRFPYIPFIYRCGFHHKIWLTIGILFSIVSFAFSFLSSSFYLIDRTKTFTTAIDSLPYEYNRIREVQKGEEPIKDNFIVTTEAKISFDSSDNINIACVENFESSFQEKCNVLFSQYQRTEDKTVHPILLTKEQLDYFALKKHSISLGDTVPITLETCYYAVSHSFYHDSFVLAGVLDIATDNTDNADSQHSYLSNRFPAILKTEDYLSCMSHTGYRTRLFNSSIADLYSSYSQYCKRNHIACPEINTDYLTLLNVYPYSSLDKKDVVSFSGTIDHLDDDFILLPHDNSDDSSLNQIYQMFHYENETDSFLKEYLENGVYRFPLKDNNGTFVVAGQYQKNDTSVTMKDCIIVSDSFYQKLIVRIRDGWKDGVSSSTIFAGKNYLKKHVLDIISDTELLSSSTWSNCLKAYDNGKKFRSFITVVSFLISLISLLIVTLFGINEKAFLKHDFSILQLLGKSKAFCYRIFSFILCFLFLFSLLISYTFSQVMTSSIFSFVCKSSGFNRTFAISNMVLPYFASFITMLILLLFSFLFSIMLKRKNTNKKEG